MASHYLFFINNKEGKAAMKTLLLTIIMVLTSSVNLISQTYSWYTLQSAPISNGKWEDVWFADAQTGWLIGGLSSNGFVYKTTDGGNNWIVADSLVGSYPRSITFKNALTGWIGTLNTAFRFLKTTDGGFTWEDDSLPGPQPSGICGMYALNEKFIFGTGAYSGTPVFIKTTNGGVTWSNKDMSNVARGLVDCYFFNEDSGIVVGSRDTFTNLYRSNILFTSDGGETWTSKYMGNRLSEECWKISFPSRLTGYVSLERAGSGPRAVAKTTNGGSEWFEVPFVNNTFVQGVGFVDENRGWVGGSANTHETTDGGLTWSPANYAGTRINRFRFLSDTLGYSCGMTVYKYGRITSVTNISQFANDFSLEQNYPNPFNPETTIKFSILKSGNVLINIYNTAGMLVSELVNSHLRAGVYETKWNASDFSSGIYLCRLVSGDFSMTRRIALVR